MTRPSTVYTLSAFTLPTPNFAPDSPVKVVFREKIGMEFWKNFDECCDPAERWRYGILLSPIRVLTPDCEPSYEVDTLDDDALLQALRDDETTRRRLEAHQATVIAEIDRRHLWRHDGHASIYGLVRVVTKRPTYEITQLVQTAKLMADKQYMDIVSRQSSTFLPGSVFDHFWRTI